MVVVAILDHQEEKVDLQDHRDHRDRQDRQDHRDLLEVVRHQDHQEHHLEEGADIFRPNTFVLINKYKTRLLQCSLQLKSI